MRAVFGALFVLGALVVLTPPLGLSTPLGPVSVGSASGSAVGVLTVRAKGDLGEEQMAVRVGGSVLATFTVGTEWADYQVDTATSGAALDVQVAFVNDRSQPEDRNLWVDSVSYGGRTYQTEDPSTYGTGVWRRGAGCQPGYHRREALACNGYFGYGDLTGTEVADGATLESGVSGEVAIIAAGSVGSELIEVRIAGETVATFELGPSSDLRVNPEFHEYRYEHQTGIDPADVEVAFVNDMYEPGNDRNVRLSSVSVGDRTYDAADLELGLSSRAQIELCLPRWDAYRIMSCNGVASIAADVAVPVNAVPEAEPVAVPSDEDAAIGPEPAAEGEPEAEPIPEPVALETVEPGDEPEDAFHEPVLIAEGAPEDIGSGAATGQFYVVGDEIIDPRGNTFYPIGANVAIKFTPYGYVFEGGNGGIGDHIDDAITWNWNTVRATLICDNTSGVPTFDELVNGIDATINRLSEAGIVVILECHDLTASDPTVGSGDELRIRRFWDEMVTRYGDNPYVWFNIFNEPYASENLVDWAVLHEFYVDRIRATGAENIVVADLPHWGQGIDLLGTSSFADELSQRCNTVLGWHAYGAIDQRQGSFADHERAIQAAKAKDMALIVGEFGVATPANWGNAGPWTWNISGFEAMAELGPRYGIGLLWWHATGDTAYYSLYALKNDRSGFWTAGNSGNLTPFGQRFWDVSHRVSHNGGPFTGDLSASNCPSAS
jgi:mannan endo-1,4-beta-mannosidase